MRRAAVLLVSLVIGSSPGASAAGPEPLAGVVPAPPPLEAPEPMERISTDAEDTVVVGEMRIERETRHFDDDVVVAPGGHLIVRDATVVFDVPTGVAMGLQVAPGGRLTIERSTLRNDALPGETAAARLFRRWTFVAQGETTITDSDLSYVQQVTVNVGPFTIQGSTIRDTWHSGLHVHRTVLPVVIRDNVIMRNHFMENSFGGTIYLSGTRGVVVEGNVIVDGVGTGVICSQSSTVGSWVWPDDVHVAGNLVYGGSMEGQISLSAYLDGGTRDLLVEENAFIVGQTGVGTSYESLARVERNTIVGAPLPGGPTPSLGVIAFNNGNTGRAYQGFASYRDNVITGVTSGIQSQLSGHPVVEGNALLGTANGIRQIAAGGQVDPAPESQLAATGNWWGSSEGPVDADATDGSKPATNAGLGSRAHGNIDYSGWATAARDVRRLAASAPAVALQPGVTTSVPVTVENRTGKTAIAEVWAFNAPPGWTVSAPLAVGVPSNGSTTIDVEITAPANAAAGTAAAPVIGVKGTNVVAASAAVVAATVA